MDLQQLVKDEAAKIHQPVLPQSLAFLEDNDEFKAYLQQNHTSMLVKNYYINLIVHQLIGKEESDVLSKMISTQEGVQAMFRSIISDLVKHPSELEYPNMPSQRGVLCS